MQLLDDEIDAAIDGLRQHVQSDIGYWSEEEVRIAFVKWRMKVLEEKERLRQEEEHRRQEEERGKTQVHDDEGENSNRLLQNKTIAINKVRLLQDIHLAKAILEKIIDKTNDNFVISIINEFDA